MNKPRVYKKDGKWWCDPRATNGSVLDWPSWSAAMQDAALMCQWKAAGVFKD